MSWWSDRINAQPAPPGPGGVYVPPTTASVPASYYPAGQAAYPQQVAMQTQQEIELPADGSVDAMTAALAWKGGKAQQEGPCPECGSNLFFSRTNTEGMPSRLPPPAPHCHDCGYPLVQAGSSRGEANSMKSSGPARRAKQLTIPVNNFHGSTIIGKV